MKQRIVFIVCLLLAQTAFAQVIASQNAASPIDLKKIEAQRVQIKQTKTQLQVKFSAEEASCQEKFAVTDCVQDVRRRRRETLTDLNRQEQDLLSQERKIKQQIQLDKLQAKSDQAASAKTLAAPSDTSSASQTQSTPPRTTPRTPQPTARASASRVKKLPQQRSAQDLALQEQKYNEKIRAAQAHRQRNERDRLSQSAKSGKAPQSSLPVPP